MAYSKNISLQDLKKGKESAWKALFAQNHKILCKYAYQFLGDSFLAEEIVDDVFMNVWKARDTIDIKVSLRSYLMRAVRNGCLDFYRRSSTIHELHLPAYPEGEADYPQLSNDDYPFGRLIENEMEGEIEKAIDSLPDNCRKVFIMSRFENKKYKEIAENLDISINTVKYHMKNALDLLRTQLLKYL